MTELLIILVIAVVIFGANRLPELGRGLGKGIRNFKDATRDAAEDGHKPQRKELVSASALLARAPSRPGRARF
jgi:sec-independent protein translocase protein TatA